MWGFSVTLILLVASCVKSEHFDECFMAQDNTYVPLVDDCRSYIYCSDNAEESFKDECPEGTYFEANEVACVIDDLNRCPRKETDIIPAVVKIEETKKEEHFTTPAEEIAATFDTTTISLHSSTAKEFVNSVDLTTPIPICDRNVDAFYPHHQRCEYYYKCVAGYLTILRCNFYYAWDYQKELCVPKKEVKCYANTKPRAFMY